MATQGLRRWISGETWLYKVLGGGYPLPWTLSNHSLTYSEVGSGREAQMDKTYNLCRLDTVDRQCWE